MRRGTVDALYWRLSSSFLRNDRNDAEKFLAMLDDELKANPGRLALEAGAIHASRYSKMREAVIRGDYGRLRGGSASPVVEWEATQAEPSGAEKDFCLGLLKSPWAMLSLIGASDRALVVPQLDMGPYGRVDFLVRDGRTWYVVEVKMGEAPTSTVSQIDRYTIAAELDMCLGLHDEVFGAVLAEGFGPYALGELSRMGVHIIEHRGDPCSLRRP
jgi:hypothetical protein